MTTPFARLLLLLPLLGAQGARGDEPLPPPSLTHKCARGGNYCADADPGKQSVCISKVGSEQPIWCKKYWERVFFLSSDGECLVASYEGMNLVSLASPPETMMLRFYQRGKLAKAITLGDLYPDFSRMGRSVSHYVWGSVSGLDEHERVTVVTEDGRLLRFNACTGREDGA